MSIDNIAHFLQHIGVTMEFHRDDHAGPYMMGAGTSDPYRATFTTREGKIGEVIVLVDNLHRDYVSNKQILAALSRELDSFPLSIHSYEGWVWHLKKKDSKSFDAGAVREKEAFYQQYIQQRYAYLTATRDTMAELLNATSYDWLTNFFFSLVMNEWPWEDEHRSHKKSTEK